MKTGKKQPVWLALGKGLLLALVVYLTGHLLLAALLVRGSVGEGGALWCSGVLCLLAVFPGGFYAARHTPWGGAAEGALFAAALALVGLACWGRLDWSGSGGALALCALCGGVAGGLCARRRKPKHRGRL